MSDNCIDHCRHLHEAHKPDEKNAAQVRIQMQLVKQLEVQVGLLQLSFLPRDAMLARY